MIDRGKEMIDRVKEYRNGNRVKRYHTVDSLVVETVGHHSANVAILCVLISENPPSTALLLAALTHDLSEQYTGDIPATAKWESKELKQALDSMEHRYNSRWFDAPISPEEKIVLKQADMLDLCFKSLEEVRMGNREFYLIFRRGLAWLESNYPLPAVKQLMREIENER